MRASGGQGAGDARGQTGSEGESGRQRADSGGATYAFEDVAFVTPAADNTIRARSNCRQVTTTSTSPLRKPSKDKKAPAPKTVVYTQPLTVPNLLSGLSTSSVILAKNIEPAGAQLNGQQQLEQPYTVSGYRITPSPVSSFPKTGELLWVFYIYNEGQPPAGSRT
jgi:hypothetical protein